MWGLPTKKNYCIKIQYNETLKTNAKQKVIDMLKKIEIDVKLNNIITIRTYAKKKELLVQLNNMAFKAEIIRQFNLTPATFNIIDHVIDKKTPLFAKVQTNFCKFSLGISKYESNTLALGELGRYPIEQKAARLSILYWLRLEQGTTNELLNHAFIECKNEQHEWIKKVFDFLNTNGLRYIWDQINNLNKDYVNSKIKQRLNDQYKQHYDGYIKNNRTTGKTYIVDVCKVKEKYERENYITNIKSPYVRNIITRLRIDCNDLPDSKLRSYKNIKCETDKCSLCENTVDSVRHFLLHCRKERLLTIRNKFYAEYGAYVKEFHNLTDEQKLAHILNVDPKAEIKDKTLNIICSFIKSMYKVHEE